ncbi:MAG TPA: TlyA family RNA methyltransferase [Solirubrobacteraceae bacterium]|jgi:23S rRNA (cytidine1920-2'-O)/16S rRNA (cytidine1409-2'-O)-methyltransferase
MGKQRLDTLLAERGIFVSRTRAAASVMAGEIQLGSERRTAGKPGEMVEEDVLVAVRERPEYVSRGGIKLANALDASGLDVSGRSALDVGASTGGFTDCLLQHGALRSIALDVAYGQLDWSLRNDQRVHVIERANARALTADALPYVPDLAVIDVSFISLLKVLPAVLSCLAGEHDVLALIKPQFEVGREQVGKGGVVREAAVRRRALVEVATATSELGESVLGLFYSGLPGPKGNRESFIWLAEQGRSGAAAGPAEIEAMAERVEG